MRAGRGRESGRGVTLRTPGSATKDLGPRYRCGRTRQTGVTLHGRHEADATASCRTLASVVGAARDQYQPRMSTDHHRPMLSARDRKSVVEGKSVSGRVELGGRRTIKTK